MNWRKLIELARRYAAQKDGGQGLPVRAIPQLPPGIPQLPQPTMRFVPGVPLDSSQVEDRRSSTEHLPIMAGGRAGPGGDRPADRYTEGDNLRSLAMRYEAARTARNRTSTGVGVNRNGKQRRRY